MEDANRFSLVSNRYNRSLRPTCQLSGRKGWLLKGPRLVKKQGTVRARMDGLVGWVESSRPTRRFAHFLGGSRRLDTLQNSLSHRMSFGIALGSTTFGKTSSFTCLSSSGYRVIRPSLVPIQVAHSLSRSDDAPRVARWHSHLAKPYQVRQASAKTGTRSLTLWRAWPARHGNS